MALVAVAAAGCGVGAGDESGSVELTVSRDHGGEVLRDEEVEINESDTVLRALDRTADLETRYGGGFVQSIDGLAGGTDDGRRSDWFYYVNGIEAPVGSADYEPADGESVWWDHHDWSTAMRVPAVVGDWPEPFVHGYGGERWPSGIYCGAARGACELIDQELTAAGVETGSDPGPADDAASGEEIRVLVGTWDEIGDDSVAGLLRGGPQRSGVFATFAGESPSSGLTLLDDRGRVTETLTAGAGLVAALRPEDGPPTWVVTGTDARGVAAAAELFGEDLDGRFAAAAIENEGSVGVPVR
jgi:hypothetical protein